jgi:serine/threonine-protein kinase
MNGDPMTEQTIGNYRVIAKLGEGGMGKVYRAIDMMVEREVALKSLKPEIAALPGIVERFRSEAILLAKLNHPAVALLYTFFKDGDQYFMAMEYVAGDTLQAVIQNGGPIPYTRALAYTAQILQGIGHAHSLGILHRDLKPANIMLTPEEKVKIMDFGIARVLGVAGITRDGRVMGTPEYLAPERIRGNQDDPRSDLYSVGVVLFQMLTGRLPFEADSDYDMLTAQIQARPPRPREIGVSLPPGVEDLLMTALEKDPARRFARAAAFEAAIASLTSAARSPGSEAQTVDMSARMSRPTVAIPVSAEVHSVPPRAPDTPPSPPAVGWMDRVRPLLYDKRAAAVVAALGVVLAVGIGWLAYRYKLAPKPAPPPKVAVTLPDAPPAPPPQLVDPSVDLGGGDGTPAPVGPGPKPAPDNGKPKPKEPPAPPPTPAPLPAVTPEARRAALAALDLTDGPSTGDPGTRPIHLAGLLAALKAGGPSMAADFEDAVGRRGVNFQLTADRADALRTAGASDSLLKTVDGKYRGKSVAAAPAPAPDTPAPAVVKPVQRISKLSQAKSLFVDCDQEAMRNLVQDEIKKELGGKIKLMDAQTGADVVMKVTLTGPNGAAVTTALGAKDHAQASATVTDSASGVSLWQEGASDRKSILKFLKSDSLKNQASHIVKDLKEAISKR